MKRITKQPDGSVKVVDERDPTPEESYLLLRLEALETEAKARNPQYKIPNRPSK